MQLWFVRIAGKWVNHTFKFYPVEKFRNKKRVEIFEIDLDDLPKKHCVWKSEDV